MPSHCPVVETYPHYSRSLRMFPFLNSDAAINGLIRELLQYVAAAQDAVIQCKEKKVEW